MNRSRYPSPDSALRSGRYRHGDSNPGTSPAGSSVHVRPPRPKRSMRTDAHTGANRAIRPQMHRNAVAGGTQARRADLPIQMQGEGF